MNAVGEKLRLARRAAPAIAIGMLVRQVVLQRNDGKRTPPTRGGWQQIDLGEYTDELSKIEDEAVAPQVAPLFHRASLNAPEQGRVINVQDIPPSHPQKPRLTVINHLIDVEDIPTS